MMIYHNLYISFREKKIMAEILFKAGMIKGIIDKVLGLQKNPTNDL